MKEEEGRVNKKEEEEKREDQTRAQNNGEPREKRVMRKVREKERSENDGFCDALRCGEKRSITSVTLCYGAKTARSPIPAPVVLLAGIVLQYHTAF